MCIYFSCVFLMYFGFMKLNAENLPNKGQGLEISHNHKLCVKHISFILCVETMLN